MNANNQIVTTPARKTILRNKARKLLLGLGGLGIAGVLMGAAPAMARDHGDYRGHEIVRRDYGHDLRRDVIVHRDYIDPVVCEPTAAVVYDTPVVCDAPVVVETDPIWVPDRFEFRTHLEFGRSIRERVLVERGHWFRR